MSVDPSLPASGTLPHALPVVCRMLRTKTFFGTYTSVGGDDGDWRAGDSSTAVYWCLDTMETAGPDDRLAHPHECCGGRQCFKPPLD
jgi:hypothetical protein